VDNNFSENVNININSNDYNDTISYRKNLSNQTNQDVNLDYNDLKNDPKNHKNINFSKNVDNNSTQNMNMNFKRSGKNPTNQNNEILDVLENKMLDALGQKPDNDSTNRENIEPNKIVNNRNTGEIQKMSSDSDNFIDSPKNIEKDSVDARASKQNSPLLVKTTFVPKNVPVVSSPTTISPSKIPNTHIDNKNSNSISTGANSGSIEEIQHLPQETQIPNSHSSNRQSDQPSTHSNSFTQPTHIPYKSEDSETKYKTSSENTQSYSDAGSSTSSRYIHSDSGNRQTDKIPETSLRPNDKYDGESATDSHIRCPKYDREKVRYEQILKYPNMRCAPRHGEDKLSSRMYNLSPTRINQIKLEDDVYSIITLSNGCGAVDCADPFTEPKCGGWYAYNKLTRECECVSLKVGNDQCIPEVAPGWNVYKIRKKNILMKAHGNGNMAEEGSSSMTFAQLVENSLQDTFFWAFMINIVLLTIASGFYSHYYGCCSSKRKETDYHLNENLMMNDVIYEA